MGKKGKIGKIICDHATINKHRASDAQPEFIALGFLYAGSTHGYSLYRQFEQHLGHVWHISQSQLYATLKRLEGRGLITGESVSDCSGLERRCFSLTAAGRLHFDAWLKEASAPSARIIKLEFVARLFFSELLGKSSPTELIAGQAAVVKEELRRLESWNARQFGDAMLPDSDRFNRLAAGFRLNQLHSMLAWLQDEVSGLFQDV